MNSMVGLRPVRRRGLVPLQSVLILAVAALILLGILSLAETMLVTLRQAMDELVPGSGASTRGQLAQLPDWSTLPSGSSSTSSGNPSGGDPLTGSSEGETEGSSSGSSSGGRGGGSGEASSAATGTAGTPNAETDDETGSSASGSAGNGNPSGTTSGEESTNSDASSNAGASTAAAVAAEASGQDKSEAWRTTVSKDNFPVGSYKCNKFVYDVTRRAGADPGTPNSSYWLLDPRRMFTNGPYPPTAEQWADPNYPIPHWRVLGPEESPRPGDVAAQQINYTDATGHVAVVTGPEQTTGTGADDGIISQSNWGFRSEQQGQVTFRRYDPEGTSDSD